MNKHEIYEQVVRLSEEIHKTGIAQKVFEAVADGDAKKAEAIIVSFPAYYPKLNNTILEFGEKINKLVGNSPEYNQEQKELHDTSEFLLYNISSMEIITDINNALVANDSEKLYEVLSNFRKENQVIVENFINFQNRATKSWNNGKTGDEGLIFSSKNNEEKGEFIFDKNIIDPLSFYLLIIFGHICECYLFAVEDEEDTDPIEPFIDAIEEVTNEAFAEFVASYNIVDWVGEDKMYQSYGQILVEAWNDEFENFEE